MRQDDQDASFVQHPIQAKLPQVFITVYFHIDKTNSHTNPGQKNQNRC
jgi:hypothetical protein